MMFHVEQMVVCVKCPVERGPNGEICPKKGAVYTIRGIEVYENNCTGFLLEEIVNPPCLYTQGFTEATFCSEIFRPVKQTSIEQFTAILNQAPERVDA